MVVVAALGARLCIAAVPHARVHGVDGGLPFGAGERMACEQFPQGFLVDASAIQPSVEAAPSATVRRLQAQVGRRRGGTVGAQDGVCELEEGVFPAVETFVERAAEG